MTKNTIVSITPLGATIIDMDGYVDNVTEYQLMLDKDLKGLPKHLGFYHVTFSIDDTKIRNGNLDFNDCEIIACELIGAYFMQDTARITMRIEELQ